MFKSISLVAAILTLSFSACAQMQEKKEAPNLRLTLTTEKTTWLRYKPAPVRITIENLSEAKVELPSSIYFRLDNRKSEDEPETTAEGVFLSPVRLTKTYGEDATGCQSDLTQDRVGVLKGTDIVLITPSTGSLILQKGEKKEFNFDLARTCWNHSISSIYPNRNLFPLVGAHSSRFNGTKYKVYFEMGFDAGMSKINGIEMPLVHNLSSNKVEIEFDWIIR